MFTFYIYSMNKTIKMCTKLLSFAMETDASCNNAYSLELKSVLCTPH